MEDLEKSIISEGIYGIVCMYINNKIPFQLVVENHNNWAFPLPENLQTEKQFLMNIKEQTLEESYVEDGEIFISTEFGDEKNYKSFALCDVKGIAFNGQPMMMKPFRDLPGIPEPKETTAKFNEPSEEDLRASMEVFKEFNPTLFKDK